MHFPVKAHYLALFITYSYSLVVKVSTKQTKNKYNHPKNSRYILNATGAYIMIKS